jgi:hypothetical protein
MITITIQVQQDGDRVNTSLLCTAKAGEGTAAEMREATAIIEAVRAGALVRLQGSHGPAFEYLVDPHNVIRKS